MIMDKETIQLISGLERLIESGKEISRYGSPDVSKFLPWKADGIHLLTLYFNENDVMVATFLQTVVKSDRVDVATGINILERFRDQLRDGTRNIHWNEPCPPKTKIYDSYNQPIVVIKPKTKKVFIVHGHDYPMRDAVSDYIRKLGLEPIILEDKPSGNKTLIEKLEEWQDVDFAIVLLSPDDIGGKNKNELKTRARQNVIFELGLFIGWLKRKNVCAISKSIEELPSDYLGPVFVNFNKDWKLSLYRELRRAGFVIDSEKI